MRVLVTGGTGFLGSHTVAALLDSGYDVRLLVRSPQRIGPALTPLGVAQPDHVVGDVTDERAVDAALDGCDAVIHAASVVSLHVRDADRILETNRTSAALVLGQAAANGLDPIIHVSSIAALRHGTADDPVTADATLTESDGTYARSKAAAEQVARDLQAKGSPVVTVYPTMVLGPHDPNVGEGTSAWRNLLRGLIPALPPGGTHIVDVRDVAAAHLAMLEPGRGPRRFVTAGRHVTTKQVVEDLERATGRQLKVRTIPAGLVHAGGAVADAVQRALPVKLPFGYEAATTLTRDNRCDDTATWRELKVTPRPLQDTITDTVRWMAEQGLITAAQAGILGEPRA
jgi:nucleoside-diphosphate-sugar epimerase